MLLDEQRETPFDLRFRLFGTFVRVSPWFWLVCLFFYFGFLKLGLQYLLIAIAAVFSSILMHEFGHVWMGRFFGSHGHIVLQGMCGLAIGSSNLSNRWQRIAVSLAGPGIQLLFFGLLFTGLTVFGQPLPFHGEFLDRLDVEKIFLIRLSIASEQPGWPEELRFAVRLLLSFNLWWALINLLPVWPLDGGQVSRELCKWASPTNGTRYSLGLSLVTAALVTINALSAATGGPTIDYVPVGDKFFIAFFAIFAIESFLLLRAEAARHRGGWRDPDDDDRLPWESDPDEWKRGR